MLMGVVMILGSCSRIRGYRDKWVGVVRRCTGGTRPKRRLGGDGGLFAGPTQPLVVRCHARKLEAAGCGCAAPLLCSRPAKAKRNGGLGFLCIAVPPIKRHGPSHPV